jgi:hypothetical protein
MRSHREENVYARTTSIGATPVARDVDVWRWALHRNGARKA